MSAYSRPADLPNYERPPVSEVVLSIQFAANPAFRSVHAGLFWQLVRDQFPLVSEQGPLQPVYETFGGVPTLQQAVQIQAFLAPPIPRFWFESEDKVYLLQLQQDRVLLNWRKSADDGVYPRYEFVRERFVREVERLDRFLQSEQLGQLRPNQCELTYINTIMLDENPHLSLDRITQLWTDQARQIDDGLTIEGTIIQTRLVMKHQGVPYGRLYISFTPALRANDLKPVVQLEMTARGRPDEETVASALQLLDRERSTIVRTFTYVTKKEMHKLWGRTDVAQS